MQLAQALRATWVKPAITAVYLGAVATIAIVTLNNRGPEVSATLSLLSPIDVGTALALSLGALMLSMLAWRSLLAGFGHPIGAGVASEIFFISQVGKYLPGSVWPAFTQVLLGRAHQIPARANGWSFVCAMALSLVTGSLIGAIVIASTAGWGYGILTVIAAVLFSAVAGAKGSDLLGRFPRLRSKLPDHLPPTRSLGTASALFGGQWILHGLHLSFLLDRMGVSGSDLVPRSIGAFALAFVAGTLFIVAPAGLGVREGVLVALLAPVGIGSSVALTASLTSRFILTIADLSTAGLAGLASVTRKRLNRSSPP